MDGVEETGWMEMMVLSMSSVAASAVAQSVVRILRRRIVVILGSNGRVE